MGVGVCSCVFHRSELHMLFSQMWGFLFESVVAMKINEWYYTVWFSVTVPLYLIATDPCPNQQGFHSCVCIVTPAVFLLCAGWLYFDVRP